MSTNPYLEKLATEIDQIASPLEFPGHAIAEFVITEYISPKNKQIHDLHIEIAKLRAGVGSLGKVLERHNAGACKEGESPIDCAKRLLSPVRDETPARDRP